jgi:hypothetical protein
MLPLMLWPIRTALDENPEYVCQRRSLFPLPMLEGVTGRGNRSPDTRTFSAEIVPYCRYYQQASLYLHPKIGNQPNKR